jgi:hypothetical protein
MMMLESSIIPRRRVPRLAVAENFFHVCREVRVENGGLAAFFFVRFG